MSIFCSLIREECNTFHSQSTVKTLESASQLPYRHMLKPFVCFHTNPAKSKGFTDSGQKNRCAFLFPQSGYEGTDLPQGIGFGERMIYNLAQGYFLTKVNL